tara:strand:+ start:21 stop:986 length:966 start_codon:yes stop_codon:yes gene_type:complete
MATSTFPTMTGAVDNTSAATFIPEIWSDEIVAAYQSALVVAPNIKNINFKGKKGDTLHIPAPTRGSANAKAEGTAVTLQNSTEGTIDVSIASHYEYTTLIEDITAVQALASLRKFYTEDAGYALAKQIDSDLLALGKQFGDDNGSGSDWVHSNSFYANGSSGIAAYAVDTVAAADDFHDLAFRQLIRHLDDNDAPMDNRFFVLPPVARGFILGTDRYVSSDFVNAGKVGNGLVANLYGVDMYVSTNCPIVETSGDNSAASANTRGAIFQHRDASVLVTQQGVRSQTQYKQEFLSTMYTADTLYGTDVLRSESGVVLSMIDD